MQRWSSGWKRRQARTPQISQKSHSPLIIFSFSNRKHLHGVLTCFVSPRKRAAPRAGRAASRGGNDLKRSRAPSRRGQPRCPLSAGVLTRNFRHLRQERSCPTRDYLIIAASLGPVDNEVSSKDGCWETIGREAVVPHECY